MFRISAFSNAAEFNELFGKQVHGNGVVSRRNKILLAFYKSKSVWNFCRKHNDWKLLSIRDMETLKKEVMYRLAQCPRRLAFQYRVALGCFEWSFPSFKYESDRYEGMCTDETAHTGDFIRYINKDSNKPYKMATGKFLRRVFLENEFGQALPEQVLTWMLEEMVKDWKVYCRSKVPEFTLKVNTNFDRIYDSSYCIGDFGSCMTDNRQDGFYYDAVKAKAAYLENEQGDILARCIVFTDVEDENGDTWRLAERQYSSDCDELLKQMLVDALIAADEIDGYKKVGADCHNASAFVDVHGNSLRNKRFSIQCDLEDGDTLSYQDSFKWYDMLEHRAYNYDNGKCADCLDDTDGTFRTELCWDDWNDCYCRNTVEVWREGNDYRIDEDLVEDSDDFRWFDGEWHYYSDILECERCGHEFLDPRYYSSRGVYSDVTDEFYCDEDCKDEAEREYIEENWYRADFEEDYVERKELLGRYLEWDGENNVYHERTFIQKNLNRYIKFKALTIRNSVIVDNTEGLDQVERFAEAYIEMLNEMKEA